MIKRMFRKIGIVLTDRQAQLIKLAIWSVFMIVLMSFLSLSATSGQSIGSSKCESTTDYSSIFISQSNIHCSGSGNVSGPGWLLLLDAILLASGVVPILLFSIVYFGKLALNRKFRESEMEQSVDYLESDEREQLLTMKATRRSYMVLNFALLVGWLVSLFMGDTHLAFWLFVIQVIGALSFRRQITPKNAK